MPSLGPASVQFSKPSSAIQICPWDLDRMASLFCSHTHQYCIMNSFMGSLSGAPSWYFPVPWEFSFLVLWPESWGFSYLLCCILHDCALSGPNDRRTQREENNGVQPHPRSLDHSFTDQRGDASSSELWLLWAHVVGRLRITWGLACEKTETRKEGGLYSEH